MGDGRYDDDENAVISILQAGRACWALSPSTEGLAQETAGLQSVQSVTGCTKVSHGCKHCYAERNLGRNSP